MANQEADNAKYGGKIFWFTNLGGNTPVVWEYTCPVNSHKVVSVQRLQYDAVGGSAVTDGVAICPLHAATLTGESAKTV